MDRWTAKSFSFAQLAVVSTSCPCQLYAKRFCGNRGNAGDFMTTKRAFVCGALLSLTASMFVFTSQHGNAADKTTSRPAPRIILNTNAIPKDTRGITSFAPVVRRVAPSVVTIFSTKTVRQSLG